MRPTGHGDIDVMCAGAESGWSSGCSFFNIIFILLCYYSIYFNFIFDDVIKFL